MHRLRRLLAIPDPSPTLPAGHGKLVCIANVLRHLGTGAFSVLLLIGLLLGGCGMPRDPENTENNVRGGVMHVGVIRGAAPWASMEDSQAHGVEVELMRRFAQRLDAQVKWVPGAESKLLGALERFELDVVIGGLQQESPWRKRVAFTRRYYSSRLMIGLPEGMRPVENLSDREVAVETHTTAARLVREHGGRPVKLARRKSAKILVAAPEWRLKQWEYEPSKPVLQLNRHVLAVPPGENRWLVTLEKFLHGQRDRMDALIRSKAGPTKAAGSSVLAAMESG